MKKIILIGLALVSLLPAALTQAVTADAQLKLEFDCSQGGTCPVTEERDDEVYTSEVFAADSIINLKVIIDNPTAQAITSVQTWLEYDPAKLEGVKVETFSNFNLVAPGEKDFDPDNGRVQIGLASTSGGVTDQEILVAQVRFKVKSGQNGQTKIGFYDYQVSELGHTNVNIIEENFPLNILANPPKTLVFNLSTPASVSNVSNSNQVAAVGGGTVDFGLHAAAAPERPTGLKLTTGNGYVYLAWDQEPNLGYNIYYGTRSGYYLHKVDVGATGAFYVEPLTNGQSYYFALKAYNEARTESDYADEVGVLVNQPESATNPLQTTTGDLSQTKTGPSVLIFLALFSGVAGYVFSRKSVLS